MDRESFLFGATLNLLLLLGWVFYVGSVVTILAVLLGSPKVTPLIGLALAFGLIVFGALSHAVAFGVALLHAAVMRLDEIGTVNRYAKKS